MKVKKIINATTSFRVRCLIKTLFWAGLRREEAVKLDARDIDFERKRITVVSGKGDKTRVVPIINDDFLSDLKYLISNKNKLKFYIKYENCRFCSFLSNII